MHITWHHIVELKGHAGATEVTSGTSNRTRLQAHMPMSEHNWCSNLVQTSAFSHISTCAFSRGSTVTLLMPFVRVHITWLVLRCSRHVLFILWGHHYLHHVRTMFEVTGFRSNCSQLYRTHITCKRGWETKTYSEHAGTTRGGGGAGGVRLAKPTWGLGISTSPHAPKTLKIKEK